MKENPSGSQLDSALLLGAIAPIEDQDRSNDTAATPSISAARWDIALGDREDLVIDRALQTDAVHDDVHAGGGGIVPPPAQPAYYQPMWLNIISAPCVRNRPPS